MAQITITMLQAKPLVEDILKAGLVPMLLSSPGVGKSALGRDIAKAWNLYFVDERLSSADPTDMNGFPMILDPKAKRVKAGYIPMETFPIEGDPIPAKKWSKEGAALEWFNGWLLMLDEFNSATQAVQAAAYKVVLDKMVGRHKLHKKVAIIGAGNLATDKAIVNRLSTAMQSRLVHLQIAVCEKAWMIWADKAKIDHRVKSFINFQPDLLHKFDPNHTDVTFPCPRTWEFTSKIIKPWKTVPAPKMPILCGTIGDGAARNFFSYCKIFDQIPTLDQILANPASVSFGDEPSIHFALAGLVGHRMNANNADPLVNFITRLGIDFQVTALRSAIARDYKIRQEKNVAKWITQNSKELQC